MLDVLKFHFNQLKQSHESGYGYEPNILIWFDLFTNYQHTAIDLDFNYWTSNFREVIQTFGQTLMILSPWNNPIPLTRAWCL